jgi:hypothetical protein
LKIKFFLLKLYYFNKNKKLNYLELIFVIYNPDLAAEQSVLYFKTVTKACGSRNVARKFDERVKESFI